MAIDMRSLSPDAKFNKRTKVIKLRHAGQSYVQIALQVGLSRTGVFDICKRHDTIGIIALRDAPAGRATGKGRIITPEQESQLRQQIVDSTPDQLAMPELLWNRTSVSRLIEQRLHLVLPVRTLALYLERWGFASRRPTIQSSNPRTPVVNRWLSDFYPVIAAKSITEGGEINWGSQSRLLAERSNQTRAGLAARASLKNSRSGSRQASMISAVNNKGQQRWAAFKGPLDARTVIDFLGRLIKGKSKKIFLITDELRVNDKSLVVLWLAEHEDEIETFPLPTRPSRSA